ncbi:DnaD domain-containing protein [Streptohalobacillus salinus]|nr:DnaD domain-containing protein [Streptohalobacillus salinus]
MPKLRLETVLHDQMSVPYTLLKDYQSFHIDETELLVILQLMRFKHEGNRFPTPSDIGVSTKFDDQLISRHLRQLMQKDLLTIEEVDNGDGIVDEMYSLEPLWNKIYTQSEKKPVGPTDDSVAIFKLFEQEFGRVLSPFEIETINIWIDQDNYEIKLIKQALREAVLMSKLNFKYIDRILSDWAKKGIKTEEQAKAQAKSFHRPQTENTPREKSDPSIYYNWLEEDE